MKKPRRIRGGAFLDCRNPLKRFDESLNGRTQDEIDGFYCDNFIDLMGGGLAPDLRRPRLSAAA